MHFLGVELNTWRYQVPSKERNVLEPSHFKGGWSFNLSRDQWFSKEKKPKIFAIVSQFANPGEKEGGITPGHKGQWEGPPPLALCALSALCSTGDLDLYCKCVLFSFFTQFSDLHWNQRGLSPKVDEESAGNNDEGSTTILGILVEWQWPGSFLGGGSNESCSNIGLNKFYIGFNFSSIIFGLNEFCICFLKVNVWLWRSYFEVLCSWMLLLLDVWSFNMFL